MLDTDKKTYIGDCLDVMKQFPEDSVDLIITSPPYADARAKTYGGVKPDDYVEWFSPRALEMKRILKPTGSFVLNIKEKAVNGERHTYVLDLILHLKRELGFYWTDEYIWHKSSSMPGKWKNRFRDGWERLLHFNISKDFKMLQDAVAVPMSEATKSRLTRINDNDRKKIPSASGSGFSRDMTNWLGRDTCNPDNVLHLSPVSNNVGHSAAFPEGIPDFFIKLFTEEGDIVLDPFVGSGTTLRVAERLGRKGIGIDTIDWSDNER